MHIVQITGTPGSGKTTLGKRIAAAFPARCAVIDTDDIDDATVLDLLQTHKQLLLENEAQFHALHAARSRVRLLEDMLRIQETKPQPELLVIVGLTIAIVPEMKVESRFVIEVDDTTLFWRLNARHWRQLCIHAKEMGELLAQGSAAAAAAAATAAQPSSLATHPVWFEMVCCYKFKVRTPFVSRFEDVAQETAMIRKRLCEGATFSYVDANTIFALVCAMLTPQQPEDS